MNISEINCKNSDSFLVAFKRARKKMHEFVSTRIEEYDLTANQVDVLSFIMRNPKYNTAKDIVEYIGVSKGLVSRSVDSLMKRGYIYVEEDDKDKRKMRIFLTKEGSKIVAIIDKYDKEFFALVTQNISKEEMHVHISIMKKVQDNLNNIK